MCAPDAAVYALDVVFQQHWCILEGIATPFAAAQSPSLLEEVLPFAAVRRELGVLVGAYYHMSLQPLPIQCIAGLLI